MVFKTKTYLKDFQAKQSVYYDIFGNKTVHREMLNHSAQNQRIHKPGKIHLAASAFLFIRHLPCPRFINMKFVKQAIYTVKIIDKLLREREREASQSQLRFLFYVITYNANKITNITDEKVEVSSQVGNWYILS